jgi:hypothetical protein
MLGYGDSLFQTKFRCNLRRLLDIRIENDER